MLRPNEGAIWKQREIARFPNHPWFSRAWLPWLWPVHRFHAKVFWRHVWRALRRGLLCPSRFKGLSQNSWWRVQWEWRHIFLKQSSNVEFWSDEFNKRAESQKLPSSRQRLNSLNMLKPCWITASQQMTLRNCIQNVQFVYWGFESVLFGRIHPISRNFSAYLNPHTPRHRTYVFTYTPHSCKPVCQKEAMDDKQPNGRTCFFGYSRYDVCICNIQYINGIKWLYIRNKKHIGIAKRFLALSDERPVGSKNGVVNQASPSLQPWTENISPRGQKLRVGINYVVSDRNRMLVKIRICQIPRLSTQDPRIFIEFGIDAPPFDHWWQETRNWREPQNPQPSNLCCQ